MAHQVRELRDTGPAKWYGETSTGEDGQARRSWTTRERYYAALLSCLAATAASRRVERDEVTTVAGEKSPSTLYLLVSGRAKGSLRERWPEAFALAERAQGADRRWDVVDNLAVETKVWSFWGHRAGWLEELDAAPSDDRRFAAETLVRVLAVWADGNRPIAAYLGHLPPASAVADLCLILPGAVPRERVMRFLTTVVETALGPLGGSPSSVLNTVHDTLMDLGFWRSPSYLDELLERSVESVDEIGYLLSRLVERDRRRVVTVLAPQLAELQRVLDKLDEEDGR
jgi:hypothetical protein